MTGKLAKSIYFLRRKDGTGPIKIGCSSSPNRRLYDFGLWSPYPLELLAQVPGTHEIERKLHRHFADSHSHSEWFFPTPELVEAIRQIASGTPVAVAVDLTVERGRIRQRKAA